MRRRPSVDVIIVTQRPDAGFRKVLSALEEQSYPPDHIIIIDSDEEGFKDRLLYGHPSAEVYHIDSSKFDAGAARNMGAGLSTADIIIFISQDAMPTSSRFIGRIVRAFGDSRVKAVFGRLKADYQAEALDASELIAVFPEISDSFTSENIRIMEGQAHMFTNVCGAYDREYFFELGMFTAPCLKYEAAMLAFEIVKNGDIVDYNSRAEVMYYYRNSFVKCFKNGFDKGVTAALHPETAGRIRYYVPERQTKNYLHEEGSRLLVIRYSIRIRFEKAGMFLGKRFRHIPGFLCRFMSRDKYFWKYKRYNTTDFESSYI